MQLLSSVNPSFGARTVVAGALLAALLACGLAQADDNCRVECYPNTKAINGKGGLSKSENCRWILRTDGKPARLCDHIKCKKVCPGPGVQQEQQLAAASSDSMHVEQLLEADAPMEPVGIMRQLHGSKLAKAPVPGVASGRLSAAPQSGAGSGAPASGAGSTPGGARRMAPTLAPAVQYDENDTPPPISRFLDISPEE